jgi:hypothetical protein
MDIGYISVLSSYAHIAVLKQLKIFTIKNVLQVCTDSIYATAISKTILDESIIKMGQELLTNFDKSLFAKVKNSTGLEEARARYNAERDIMPS